MRVNAANTPGLGLTNIKIRVLKHLLLVVSLFNQTNTNKQIFQDDNNWQTDWHDDLSKSNLYKQTDSTQSVWVSAKFEQKWQNVIFQKQIITIYISPNNQLQIFSSLAFLSLVWAKFWFVLLIFDCNYSINANYFSFVVRLACNKPGIFLQSHSFTVPVCHNIIYCDFQTSLQLSTPNSLMNIPVIILCRAKQTGTDLMEQIGFNVWNSEFFSAVSLNLD